jgi:hypothetical protein
MRNIEVDSIIRAVIIDRRATSACHGGSDVSEEIYYEGIGLKKGELK